MAGPIQVRAYVGKSGRYVSGYTRRHLTLSQMPSYAMRSGRGRRVLAGGWTGVASSKGKGLVVSSSGTVRTKTAFGMWPKRRVTPSSRGRIERLFSNVQSRGKTGRFPY